MKRATNHLLKMMVVIVTLLFLFFIGMESIAFARAGGGRSFGSRGFSSGGSYQRNTPSQPSQPTQQPGMSQRPPVQQSAPSMGMGRSFLYGLGGGLFGGMIGSMLFGGHGYAGGQGWGGGGFGFGDIIIILVILAIIYFVVKRFRARREMQMSSQGSAYAPSYTYDAPAAEEAYAPSTMEEGLRYIREMDPSFNEDRFKESVEDNFFKIQSAWTKRDLSGARHLLTPQMLSTFQEDINKTITDKQTNHLENIAVRQVEIVDAAQDQGEEYITVKFLASLLDYTIDETNNHVISGSSTNPVKFLEYWTFTRKIGEKNWVLAGITQEGDY
jgi:predicted lipid-binding transport protein (Tim44 family)